MHCLTFTYFYTLVTSMLSMFFFFNDTATTEIYTLSLHDALPISAWAGERVHRLPCPAAVPAHHQAGGTADPAQRERRQCGGPRKPAGHPRGAGIWPGGSLPTQV